MSWISTETPGRYDHVVFAKGMNDSQFALNPIVTLNHDYTCPPIGRSLWRRFVKDSNLSRRRCGQLPRVTLLVVALSLTRRVRHGS